MYMKKGYRCQEIPLEVYAVRLTFEDLKFIIDWLGSGEVEPGEGCIFLASPEEKSMVRGVSRDILWICKYSGQVLRKLDCSIVQSLRKEPRFKSVITKPAIVAAAVATYLSADARVGVRDKTGR